jgi:enediyne polyketide synthase
MACRYADAASPADLWQNVLAQRRAFRLFPKERLDLAEYWSSDPRAVDSIYARRGTFIEDFHFDRLHYRIAGDTYRSADMTHWLALASATTALADAGYPDGSGLPKETTGVFVGNTLTGEFSRAGVLRQRWPYVRKVLSSVLEQEGFKQSESVALINKLEPAYKQPFPPPGPETLAGSLSNTIAGRICNYYNLGGGGYSVDGACASSLLSVIHGCSALLSGDLDVAVVGGVDLSLDPLELIGFCRMGAIASDGMRIFDANPTGFLPGEGCSFIVLERYADALAAGHRIYSVIKGWGISSDGAGGLTRPEVKGQTLALRRAYRRAGFSIADVDYFEAHGTGTEVGDTVELQALMAERKAAGATRRATIGSVKAIIGHTKAAAGIAGLLKACLSVWHGVVPPTTGCVSPHPELCKDGASLEIARESRPWETAGPRRAAISSMAFGGLNTHLVLEQAPGVMPQPCPITIDTCIASDCELFLLSAESPADLLSEVKRQMSFVPAMSLAELSDFAAALAKRPARAIRAAIVASTPEELHDRLQTVAGCLQEGAFHHLDAAGGVFLSLPGELRIGFLFSGQASPVRRNSGVLGKYFAASRWPYLHAPIPQGADTDTEVAQRAMIAASLAGAGALEELGIAAEAAIGHSVGEIGALCWAGVLSRESALAITAARGRAMEATVEGAMISISAPAETVKAFCADDSLEIAAMNSARHTVLCGDRRSIARALDRAKAAGWPATPLPVAHAFHSRAMMPAIEPLRQALLQQKMGTLQRRLYSTVTGKLLPPETDISSLLLEQITAPVRFAQALQAAVASGINLFIEVGPGSVLTRLAKDSVSVPVVALDACSDSHFGFLSTVGLAFALGSAVVTENLFGKRFTRHFDLEKRKTFFSNPCELVPSSYNGTAHSPAAELPEPTTALPVEAVAAEARPPAAVDAVLVVRELVANSGELPLSQIGENDRFLDDLRLNSIVVAEVAARAAQALGRPPLRTPTAFSNATIQQLAAALTGDDKPPAPADGIAGLSSWVRCFRTVYEVTPPVQQGGWPSAGLWTVYAAEDHFLRRELEQVFSQPGSGVVFCVPPGDTGESAAAILGVLQRLDTGERFVCVDCGTGCYSSFLRSVYAERPDLNIALIHLPSTGNLSAYAYAEGLAAQGFVEAWYAEDGTRRIPALLAHPLHLPPHVPLSPADVLLVTGGARGIGAECALALAQQSGARLLLLGRSALHESAEATKNIVRLSAAGVPFLYAQCDVADAASVTRTLGELQHTFGKVTAVLHAAGRNVPTPFASTTAADLDATAAPKVDGLQNILAALDESSLRLCISFGSIIGRIGTPGNADYALANERLRLSMEQAEKRLPACRFLTVEWSLWSGVGMAERLGSVESFARQGLAAISPEQGTRILAEMLADPALSGAVIVTGQFTQLPNYSLAGAAPPLLRFAEKVLRFIPGVELMTEAALTLSVDPYLLDHRLGGSLLFPAVMGMEAMAEAAGILGLDTNTLLIEDLHFEHPIVTAEMGETRIRVLAVREPAGHVRVAVRSETTDFQIDHFYATLRNVGGWMTVAAPALVVAAASALPEHTPDDIYSSILFQAGRLRRIQRYRALTAKTCSAELQCRNDAWFAAYMPPALVLGDPGIRDAMMHAIQACIPSHVIVPTSVESVMRRTYDHGEGVFVVAQERERRGTAFLWDIDLQTSGGEVLEQWRGVVFQQVEPVPADGYLTSPLLLPPYLERKAADLFSNRGIPLELRLEGAAVGSADLLRSVSGAAGPILRRSDGKPQVLSGFGDLQQWISASNTEGLSMAVGASLPVGCDVELIREREESIWEGILGGERFAFCRYLASTRPSRFDELATRLWCVHEALQKTGFDEPGLVRLGDEHADGWMEFHCRKALIITWAPPLQRPGAALAVAVIHQPVAVQRLALSAVS